MTTRQTPLVVVGAGTMGSQIALLGALAKYRVTLCDINHGALENARLEIDTRLARMMQKGDLSLEVSEEVAGRLTYGTDPLGPAADAHIVIEAIVEKLDVKRELFTALDAAAPPGTFFASNSSSIVPSRIAGDDIRPDRFAVMHFFNPPLLMKCVEIVRSPRTNDITVRALTALAEAMGKKPVALNKESPGFVANRIVNALCREAIRLYEGGYASPADVDEICRSALRHPMGPFELLDMAGIDVNYHMQQSFYEQTQDPAELPQTTILRLFEEGAFGRKAGRGFYEYGDKK
jgi:3-hydroxybutyryl-CoA dehydrogenase